ncbi:MAG: hypothetical protein HUJ75_00250 [Parasporobacterium sp.]|nr:hypothetical protein [Parasporobacterium sp.]
MNSFEKYGKMLSLTPYADRRDIPVFPMCLASYGSLGGVTQAETMKSPQHWLQAVENTWAKIGTPDVSMAMNPLDTTFIMGLPVRLPGRELPEDALYQFVETPYFDDASEYDKILQMGYTPWYMQYLCSIQNPPFTSPDQLGQRFGMLGANMGVTIPFLIQHGVVPCFETACAPIFDQLSMIRSMQEFTFDLYDEGDKIKAIIEKFQAADVENTIGQAKATGVQKIGIFAMRSSSTFVSPALFEEFAWPALKGMIEAFHAAGFVSVLHADANWLPMMKYFTELPKGSVHIELDGDTDIFETYEILKGWQSIRGDVPATMFAYGTPDQVSEYCEKLIQMGMQGGFMLSSGCEVPMNAKVECVKAMMDSVR